MDHDRICQTNNDTELSESGNVAINSSRTTASSGTPTCIIRSQPQQSIEDFASNNNHPHDNHLGITNEPRPPTSINVPEITIPDDQSTTSSITLAGAFRNADLYVSSLYPSTLGIINEARELEEVVDRLRRIELPVENSDNGGMQPPPAATASTLAVGAASGARSPADDKRKKPYYFQKHHVQSTAPQNNDGNPMGLSELGQIELSVLKSEQQNTDPQAGEDPIMSLPANQVEDVISGIMPLPDGRTTREQQQQPMGPGAHAISSPGGWNPFGGQSLGTEDTKEDSKEESKRDTNLNNNNATLGLAEAQPAEALPIAELDEESGEQQQKQKKRGHISFLGFITGLPRPCHYLLMAAFAVIMVKWSTYIIRSIIVGARDPAILRIRQSIEESFGKDYFDSKLKEKALHWIIHEDPLQDLEVKQGLQEGSETSSHLIQRFSLVAFYFQTSATQPWSHCNPPQGKQSDVCFHRSGQREERAVRWLSAAHECHWMGVYCEGGSRTVSMMRLPHKNMTGQIPSELAKLSNIKSLDLSHNNLSGALPLWINQLTSIETIYLNNNFFRGHVPPKIFSIPTLSELSLYSNHLTGRIPSQISLFSGRSLRLANNSFSGPIPKEIYLLSNLQYLLMGQNSLTGTISTLIGKLTDLEGLYLYSNELREMLPTEVGLLGRLTHLNLTRTNLDGTIPEELFNLESLLRLDISDTKIGGTISSRIGQLGGLESFSLANTKISGTIPEQISLLSNLKIFHANGNPSLSGFMPVEFCTNRLQHSDIVVDCSPAASTGVPAIMCPKGCCSSCCDAETKICMEQ